MIPTLPRDRTREARRLIAIVRKVNLSRPKRRRAFDALCGMMGVWGTTEGSLPEYGVICASWWLLKDARYGSPRAHGAWAVWTVEDVVQESLLILWRRLPDIPEPARGLGVDDVRRYFRQIIRNQLRSGWRKAELLMPRVARDPDTIMLLPPDAPGRAEPSETSAKLRVEAIADAMASLSPALRAVARLKIHTSLTHAQIGEELGITEGAAQRRWSRAFKQLAKELRAKGLLLGFRAKKGVTGRDTATGPK